MEITTATGTSIHFSIENVSSIEEMRKTLFFLRNGSVIIPDKKMCSLYKTKHGDVFTNSLWHNEKESATVIGVYDSKLWFQFLKTDNGKLSYWGSIREPSDFILNGEFAFTGENIEPQYITHYELYTIIYNNPHCIFKKGVEFSMEYPICPTIFLPPIDSCFKDDAQIIESGVDYISTLPLEILFEIFQNCSGLDIFYSMLVSKVWHEKLKQCGVWKKLCIDFGIKYNETILHKDYDGNQAEYYFSHGLERKLILNIENPSDINSFCNKNYYLGGLYWNFTKTTKGFHMNVSNISIKEFNGIKISILINVSTKDASFKYSKLYNYSPYTVPLFFECEAATRYTITVKVHHSLISLMYYTVLK